MLGDLSEWPSSYNVLQDKTRPSVSPITRPFYCYKEEFTLTQLNGCNQLLYFASLCVSAYVDDPFAGK